MNFYAFIFDVAYDKNYDLSTMQSLQYEKFCQIETLKLKISKFKKLSQIFAYKIVTSAV